MNFPASKNIESLKLREVYIKDNYEGDFKELFRCFDLSTYFISKDFIEPDFLAPHLIVGNEVDITENGENHSIRIVLSRYLQF